MKGTSTAQKASGQEKEKTKKIQLNILPNVKITSKEFRLAVNHATLLKNPHRNLDKQMAGSESLWAPC